MADFNEKTLNEDCDHEMPCPNGSGKPVRALSLKVNFSWSLIGNVVYNACQWGILAAFNKLEGTTSAGLFILGLTITTPITQFCSLQLRSVYVSDVKEEYRFSDYLGTRYVWNFIALSLCVLASLFYWPSTEKMLIIIAVGIAANIQATGEIYVSLFQKRERMNLLAFSSIIKGILNLVGVVLVFWLTTSVLYAAISMIVTRFLGIVLYDRVYAAKMFGTMTGNGGNDWKSIRPCYVLPKMKKISIISFPLGLTMLMISLSPQIPRLFLTQYADISVLGIFGSISYIMVAGNMLMAALGTTLSPRLARSYESGNKRDYVRLIKISALLFIGIGLACILVVSLFGDLILKLLYNDEYVGHKNILVILTCGAAAGFMTSVAGYALTAARCFKVQPYILFANTVLVFATCALWIPPYGITGAAWAVFVPTLLNMSAFLVVLKIAVDRCGKIDAK